MLPLDAVPIPVAMFPPLASPHYSGSAKMRPHRAVRTLFQEDFVHVAPAPVFARFERLDDGVVRGVKVLGGVLVLRTVAAADVPAAEAEPQVHPGVAHLKAFLAAFAAGVHFVDLVDVRARFAHGSLLMEFSNALSRASQRRPPHSRDPVDTARAGTLP